MLFKTIPSFDTDEKKDSTDDEIWEAEDLGDLIAREEKKRRNK